MAVQPSVTVRVPAKVNLQLAVGAPRPDGFHEIATVFHAVSLYDEVTARRPGPGSGATEVGEVTVTVEADASVTPAVDCDAVPLDATNLAVRAALLLAERAGVPGAVDLELRKGIPVAGGMAGGSADAAGALLACDALWGTALDRGELAALAAELGSDVPFALVGGTAIGLGRGEELMPALSRGHFTWVLAVADGGLSTPEVYGECDRLRAGRVIPEPHVSDRLMSALRAGDATALGRALVNDLQPAACSLRPALQRTLAVGEDHEVLGAVVSGSGPTVAFLVRDHSHALDLAIGLTAAGVCRSVRRATGAVHGARILETTVPSTGAEVPR